jgi:hypothetical protein
MERELVPRKSLAQYIQNPLGILKSANAITASSAKRTRVLFPLSRGFTSFTNHSSST